MAFNSWRAERPDLLASGMVMSWNDHTAKTCGVLWNGPSTPGLDAVSAEATRRGITFIAKPARFSPEALDAAVAAVMDAREELWRLGFDLSMVTGRGFNPEGVVLKGRPTSQASGHPDRVLPDALIARVRQYLADLPELAGRIPPDAVHVEYGVAFRA